MPDSCVWHKTVLSNQVLIYAVTKKLTATGQ